MSERDILHDVRLKAGQLPGVALWRNNVGIATFPGGRKVPYGLIQGASDIIGIRALLITPDHLGQTIGQFVAIETKTPEGRLTEKQRLFLQLIRARGGVALTARDAQTAVEALST